MAIINAVRVIKTKYGTYSLHYTNPDGRRRRLSVGSDKQIAQRQALRFTDWLLEGKDPETELERAERKEKAQSISIQDFFRIFMSRHGIQKSPKTQKSYRNGFRNICRCPELAESKLNTISRGTVLDYMHARMENDNVTTSTVNREAALLKVMLSCANEWDITDLNPLLGLKLFKEAPKREVILSQKQAALLLYELPEPIANIVEFAIYSGFRRENILGLRIEDVYFHDITDTGEVKLIVKGGRRETFQLSKNAVEVLKRAIGERNTGYVFINP